MPSANIKQKKQAQIFCDYPENPHFVARTEVLYSIHKHLQAKTNKETIETRSSVIYGLPGMGKTQTALRYVHTHKDDFDIILWVTATDRMKIINSFSKYADLLGVVKKSFDQNIDAIKLVRWLEESS